MKRTTLLLFFLLVLFSPPCFSDPTIPDEEDRSDFIFEPDLHWIGLTLGVGYRGVSFIRGRDTVFWLAGGGEFDERGYYFLPDGTPITDETQDIDPEKDVFFWRLNGHWRLGISQGLIYNRALERNWLETFFYYRGFYEHYFPDKNGNQLFFRSDRPDTGGMFQNSLLFGFSADSVQQDEESKVYDGYHTEISVEWAPHWFANNVAGEANFVRFNTTLQSFLPLFISYNDAGKRMFSTYAGVFTAADYILGDAVPLHAAQSLGGLDPRIGLGEAVRGIDSGRYSTRFKLVGNIEIRGNLPSLIWPGLYPGILIYFDSGFYSNFDGTATGGLVTTGFGVFIDFFGWGELVVYTQILMNDTNVYGSKFIPFNFELGLHF